MVKNCPIHNSVAYSSFVSNDFIYISKSMWMFLIFWKNFQKLTELYEFRICFCKDLKNNKMYKVFLLTYHDYSLEFFISHFQKYKKILKKCKFRKIKKFIYYKKSILCTYICWKFLSICHQLFGILLNKIFRHL